MTDPAATTPSPSARLHAAGYRRFALDLSGGSYLAPDGLRVLTTAQAIADLDRRQPTIPTRTEAP